MKALTIKKSDLVVSNNIVVQLDSFDNALPGFTPNLVTELGVVEPKHFDISKLFDDDDSNDGFVANTSGKHAAEENNNAAAEVDENGFCVNRKRFARDLDTAHVNGTNQVDEFGIVSRRKPATDDEVSTNGVPTIDVDDRSTTIDHRYVKISSASTTCI